MITIQLAPAEELENKHWYIPDLIILLIFGCAIWFAVDYHLKTIEEKIATLQEEKEKLVKSTERLSSDLKRYDTMNQKIKDLENKILSLKNITVSKVARFKPIVILEHLQNLKPEGIWFQSLSDNSEENILTLKAGAFDNLLVAEFMSSLESTRHQEPDVMNVRSQIFFSDLYLEKIALPGAQEKNNKEQGGNAEVQAAFKAAQHNPLNEINEGAGGATGESQSFPEMEKFPRFELRIKYNERNIDENQLNPIAKN